MTVLFLRVTSGQYTRTVSNNGRVAARSRAVSNLVWEELGGVSG